MAIRLSLLLPLAVLGGALWWLRKPVVPEERVLQMTVVSPDGAKEARVHSIRWSGPLAVDTNIEETIELSERGHPSAIAPSALDTVARYDMERGAVVAVLWQDARHLVVVTSANLQPGMPLRSLGGISSKALTFDPRSPSTSCLAACAPWPYEMIPPVNGVVVDAASHRPIAGAVVRFEEFPETAVHSASDGSFSIAAVRKWQVVIVGTDMQTGFGLAVDAHGDASAVQRFETGDLPQHVIAMKRYGS